MEDNGRHSRKGSLTASLKHAHLLTSSPLKREKPLMRLLIDRFEDSLDELGVDAASDAQLESWACLVHESMSGSGRNFHGVMHVFDISVKADAIQSIAAMFHDTIYWSIDGALFGSQADILKDVVTETDGVVTLNHIDADENLRMVAMLFDFEIGQQLMPFGGLNEFLSAVLAVRSMANTLNRSDLAQVALCIEATIPFRKVDRMTGLTPPEYQHARLIKVNETFDLGLDEEELIDAVVRSTDLANRDVSNFHGDVFQFIDNTWKLLPESNIPLRASSQYTISNYQQALKKQDGFFSNLDPNTIFQSFKNKPSEELLKSMNNNAAYNISITSKYVRVKLISASILASFAKLSGGNVDVPLSLFMGDLPGPEHNSDVWQDHMPPMETSIGEGGNEAVYNLLWKGRLSESSFDVRNSPLGAMVYYSLKDKGLEKAVQYAVHPMNEKNARLLLQSLPEDKVLVMIDIISKFAITRAAALSDLKREVQSSWYK